LEWGADFTGTVTDVTSSTTALTVATSTTTPALTIRPATTSVNGIVQLSDSTSTTSSILAATPTAVKSAYDLAALALPKAGGTVTGDITLGTNVGIQFEGTTDDANEIRLIAADATADRTITLPNVTGTVITTGDVDTVTSTIIASGTIVNANINNSAAIAYSKLALSSGIVDTDIGASAAIALSKLATGALPTGITVASGNIVDGTITNADINASAAIADTKLATISTAGKVSGTAITSGTIATSGELQITNAAPAIRLTESGGTATHSQTYLARDNDQFAIQTRKSTGVALSNDYLIPANSSGATDHIWRIANTEKARLNSSGLTVVDDLTISDKIVHAGDTTTAIRFPAADTIALETNGSERARINSSGKLLVGTSTAGNVGNFNGIMQLKQSSDACTLSLLSEITNDFGSYLILGKSRGVNGLVNNDDYLGRITFAGGDSTDVNTPAAFIECRVDGTPGANDMPGRLVFSTTADGAASPTERLRITSAGVLQVADAGNITVGTTTGTKIGTATTQKLGFYDATPVVQPTAVADATDAATVITQLNALLTRMRNLGLIAT
jgi:hypothetical protein